MGHSHSARFGGGWNRAAIALSLASACALSHAQDTPRPPENTVAHSPSEYALARNAMPTNSVRLFGDYYLFDPTRSSLGPTLGSLVGGFRISTGVYGLSQPVSLFDTAPDAAQNLPYIGLGYSRLWFHSQLSFNADFGLASQGGTIANKARGLFGGAPSLDDAAGAVRWAPVMALNVRYSF